MHRVQTQFTQSHAQIHVQKMTPLHKSCNKVDTLYITLKHKLHKYISRSDHLSPTGLRTRVLSSARPTTAKVRIDLCFLCFAYMVRVCTSVFESVQGAEFLQ